MSTPETDYQIVSRVQRNKWIEATQQAVEGMEVRARWTRTGTVLTVFVPLDQYNAANVDAAIRQAGYADEEVGKLGGAGG